MDGTGSRSSILDTIGVEIIGVMSPVSICMFLVVLLVYSLSSPSSSDQTIRTAANLIYLENPSDSTSTKIEGSLLNAAVFVILIAAVTFLLVLLYYYNFTNFLKNYMRFSAFFVLGAMGGSVFLTVIRHFSTPVDSITCGVLMFNFTVVGVMSVFSDGGAVPICVRQGYMVLLGIFIAVWFTKLPEWTTWSLLVALALYDLVAVLAPGGPLKLLVELASSRDDELPAFVYEARPTASRPALGLLVGMVSDSHGSVELQEVNNHTSNEVYHDETGSSDEGETSPLVPSLLDHRERERDRSHSTRSRSWSSSDYSVVVDAAGSVVDRNRGSEIVRHDDRDEEMPVLAEMLDMENERELMMRRGRDNQESLFTMSRGIKLGLGDFVFYSVLVGRAAMYDMMTVYACYLAIISGLGCTLILLAVCHHALPALPISIALGIMFYFLTRVLMEPFVVGTSTNLMMF